MTAYFDPEKLDLETIGEIQWGEACYDFDLTAVWRRKEDGAFLYADDSGCSCPSPFEDTTLDDLKPATPLAEFKAYLESRNADGMARTYGAFDESAAIAELLERMHKAGAR